MVHTTKSEKKHITAILSGVATRAMLLLMIIFKVKMTRLIHDQGSSSYYTPEESMGGRRYYEAVDTERMDCVHKEIAVAACP